MTSFSTARYFFYQRNPSRYLLSLSLTPFIAFDFGDLFAYLMSSFFVLSVLSREACVVSAYKRSELKERDMVLLLSVISNLPVKSFMFEVDFSSNFSAHILLPFSLFFSSSG